MRWEEHTGPDRHRHSASPPPISPPGEAGGKAESRPRLLGGKKPSNLLRDTLSHFVIYLLGKANSSPSTLFSSQDKVDWLGVLNSYPRHLIFDF